MLCLVQGGAQAPRCSGVLALSPRTTANGMPAHPLASGAGCHRRGRAWPAHLQPALPRLLRHASQPGGVCAQVRTRAAQGRALGPPKAPADGSAARASYAAWAGASSAASPVLHRRLALPRPRLPCRVGRTGRLAADGHAYTFFTREMARLAPPLVQLLQQHGQALDPNLAKLADAWRTAADKLASLGDALGDACCCVVAAGLAGGFALHLHQPTDGTVHCPPAGEEAAVPDRDDVLRQLGMPTAQQKKKQKRDQAARLGERGGDASTPQQAPLGGQGAAAAAAAAAAAEAQPAFVPSRAWGGERPGYAFKKGLQGQGYYLDAVQQQRRGERSKGKRADGTGQPREEKEYRQQLRQKYTHAPIGGKAAAHDKPQQVLPGRLKELKRQRQLAAAAGVLEGFSSDDEEGAAGSAQPSKRLKALPGRLRKKLAKQRGPAAS